MNRERVTRFTAAIKDLATILRLRRNEFEHVLKTLVYGVELLNQRELSGQETHEEWIEEVAQEITKRLLEGCDDDSKQGDSGAGGSGGNRDGDQVGSEKASPVHE